MYVVIFKKIIPTCKVPFSKSENVTSVRPTHTSGKHVTLMLHVSTSHQNVTMTRHADTSHQHVTPTRHTKPSHQHVKPTCHTNTSYQQVTPTCHSNKSHQHVTTTRRTNTPLMKPCMEPHERGLPLRLSPSLPETQMEELAFYLLAALMDSFDVEFSNRLVTSL